LREHIAGSGNKKGSGAGRNSRYQVTKTIKSLSIQFIFIQEKRIWLNFRYQPVTTIMI
jgi:hypothetical protein